MARRPFLWSFALIGALLAVAHTHTQPAPFTVRITSPLGRTGVSGVVRIVAQLQTPPAAAPGQVRFYVDRQLLGTVQQPPYAVEWVDENPYERREIAVEAVDTLGNSAADTVVLEPFEVTDTAEVTSVLVEASIQDRHGRFVKDIAPSAFRVFEDDMEQSIDLVHHETVGATFALLVDSSASMSRRMDFVHDTARTLAGYMTPRDRMLIAPFSRTLGPVTGPTDDRRTIVEGIRAIQPSGGTAILDSVKEVAGALSSAEGRRAIVLITDGYDEHSTASIDEALATVKGAGATMYVVGIGGVAGISIKGQRLLRQLAVETGGRFFFPSRDHELAEVHDVLTQDVQNRYLLAYTPQNQKTDGAWRRIEVRTDGPEHVIRARPGYFAPKPAPIRPALEFTATGPGGEYLDLNAERIEIVENGVPQKLEIFQEAVQPVSIVLALDASGSMKKSEADVVASARGFIDALRPQDKLGLMLFADRAELAQDLATSRPAMHAVLDTYTANGGTALYDAVVNSLTRLKRVDGRRVVVVMTDGRDENNPGTAPGSVSRLEDVHRLVQETGALVFAIGLGVKVDHEPLLKMAAWSGGRALFPAEVEELPGEFHRVVDDLRRRYVVGYTSSHVEHDGSWRQVEIRVADAPDVTVRSAGGYYAPQQ